MSDDYEVVKWELGRAMLAIAEILYLAKANFYISGFEYSNVDMNALKIEKVIGIAEKALRGDK